MKRNTGTGNEINFTNSKSSLKLDRLNLFNYYTQNIIYVFKYLFLFAILTILNEMNEQLALNWCIVEKLFD
jgi:hypothetical protein